MTRGWLKDPFLERTKAYKEHNYNN